MITAIALDDEPVALDIIDNFARRISFIELAKTFTNALEASRFIKENRIDLLFLDIKMPDISGMDFYQQLSYRPLVIFTTAYQQHAVQSYELDALDYLLKPFSFERFEKSCRKAKEMMTLQQAAVEEDQVLILKSGHEQIRVATREIIYIESAGNYMTFTLVSGKVVTRLTVQQALALLPEADFVRVHRSFIVSKSRVTGIQKGQLRLDKHLIPVGNMYAEQLNLLLQP